MALIRLIQVSILIFTLMLPNVASSRGSKKPKEQRFSPTALDYKKRIIAIDDFMARHIFAQHQDGENFELMLFRQYIDLLMESGRYTIRVEGSRGPAILERDKTGALGLRYDSKMAELRASENELCRFYDEQFLLKGFVTSFEIESSRGFRAGLNPSIGLYGIGAGLSFTAKKARMTVSLQASDAYNERVLASAETEAKQSERSFSFNLSYMALANIGYESYKKTPLSEVSRAALISGINRLNNQLEAYDWQGRVLATNGDDVILLNAGIDAGFRNGDEIEVLHYAPQDDPKCRKLPINGNYGRPGTVLGRFRIYQSELTHAWAELIERKTEAPLLTGSKVRSVARSLQLAESSR